MQLPYLNNRCEAQTIKIQGCEKEGNDQTGMNQDQPGERFVNFRPGTLHANVVERSRRFYLFNCRPGTPPRQRGGSGTIPKVLSLSPLRRPVPIKWVGCTKNLRSYFSTFRFTALRWTRLGQLLLAFL